jgi:GNAT superfamily N-acetyltransferase
MWNHTAVPGLPVIVAELRLCEVPASDWGVIERIGRLRVQAWADVVGTVDGMTCWLNAVDAVARHWAFFCGDEPVAAARLSVHQAISQVPDAEVFSPVFRESPPGPIASLNRLVVAPAYRGIGLSSRLDQVRLEAAEAMGCKCVVGYTASGERRVKQLKKAGFVVLAQGNRAPDPFHARLPPPVILMSRLPRAQRLTG